MRYFIRVEDLANARGGDEQFSWDGQSPQDLAASITQSLRNTDLISRWREAQPEPNEVDEQLLQIDTAASVSAEQRAHQVHFVVTTTLPHRVLAQRLNLLIGSNWSLGDVQS